MDHAVFYVQLAISLAVYLILISRHGVPWLDSLTREEAIIALLVPHAFRHAGLFSLTHAAFNSEIPWTWASTVAVGDMTTQALSVTAIVLLQRAAPGRFAVAWIANIVGILASTASMYELAVTAVPIHQLYPGWFLPVFYLPLVAVTNYYLTIRYLRR